MLFGGGYFGDLVKIVVIYCMIVGVCYVIFGDMVECLFDGWLWLFGCGSLCINIGGEKVFVEEVEEVLKCVFGIDDVMVFGVFDL